MARTRGNSTQMNTLGNRNALPSIATLGFVFFVMGFISWVNAILIPYFRIACELTNFNSYLVTFAFYIAYLLMSVPSAYLLQWGGFKNGMMIGFWIMAMGAFMFIPAALGRTYQMFLTGLFIIGAGLAIIQTAANPYITIIGPKESAAQRLSIMGICNKGAGILAPILFAAVILRTTDNELFKSLPSMNSSEREFALDLLIRRVIGPYIVVGLVLLGMGLLIRRANLPEISTEGHTRTRPHRKGNRSNIFHFPHLVLGAIGIFLHVGTQVIAIDTIIGYGNSMGLNLIEAKSFPSYTLAATIVGYIVGIICVPRWFSQVTVLRACTLLGLFFSVMILFAHGEIAIFGHRVDISIWFLVLLGLANSMIWAGIWPLALDGLGEFTKLGSSFLIMGLSGNALLPLLYGFLADKFSAREGYWVLVPCYLYISFYAFYGHQLRTWSLGGFKKIEGL